MLSQPTDRRKWRSKTKRRKKKRKQKIKKRNFSPVAINKLSWRSFILSCILRVVHARAHTEIHWVHPWNLKRQNWNNKRHHIIAYKLNRSYSVRFIEWLSSKQNENVEIENKRSKRRRCERREKNNINWNGMREDNISSPATDSSQFSLIYDKHNDWTHFSYFHLFAFFYCRHKFRCPMIGR